MAEKNFAIKITLDEANQIRDSLRKHRDEIMDNISADNANDSDRYKVGVIDTILRRDFGG